MKGLIATLCCIRPRVGVALCNSIALNHLVRWVARGTHLISAILLAALRSGSLRDRRAMYVVAR